MSMLEIIDFGMMAWSGFFSNTGSISFNWIGAARSEGCYTGLNELVLDSYARNLEFRYLFELF